MSENGKDGGGEGPDTRDGDARGKRERGNESATEGGRTRTKSGTKRPRV